MAMLAQLKYCGNRGYRRLPLLNLFQAAKSAKPITAIRIRKNKYFITMAINSNATSKPIINQLILRF
jgi:hypothetical protein